MPSSIRILRLRQIPRPSPTAPPGKEPSRTRWAPPSPTLVLLNASSSGPSEVDESPQQNPVQHGAQHEDDYERPFPFHSNKNHRQRDEHGKHRRRKPRERSESAAHRGQYPQYVCPHHHILSQLPDEGETIDKQHKCAP